MWQKGFATIFGLCLVLGIALIVKGIQEAEANHAREVLNFQMEQALQSAAESGIVEAAEYVRATPDFLPYTEGDFTVAKTIPVSSKTFKRADKIFKITVEVRGERGKIYQCPASRNKVYKKDAHVGVYLMSRATIQSGTWNEKIYRRAYAYFLDDDDTTIHFMELPTRDGSYVIKSK